MQTRCLRASRLFARCFVVTFSLLFASSLCAQLTITNHRPVRHSIDSPVGQGLTLNFSSTIDTTTVTNSSVVTIGTMSGRHTHTFAFNLPPTRTQAASINNYIAGERVEVIATGAITNQAGTVNLTPYVFRFWVANGLGTGDFNDGSTTFGGATDVTQDVRFADVDVDGDLDIVQGVYGGQNKVYANDGSGNYGSSINFGSGSDNTRTVLAADVDSDRDIDLFLCNNGANTIYKYSGGAYSVAWTDTLTLNTFHACAGDVDADGDTDFFATTLTADATNQHILYINNGTGTGFTTSNIGSNGDKGRGCDFGDVDLDGDIDLVIGHFGQQDEVWVNDGSGNFTFSQNVGTGSEDTRAIVFADVDGDFYLDIISAAAGGQDVIYMNDGDGTFDTTSVTLGGAATTSWGIVAGDVDGDSDMDIAINTESQNVVYINDGAGTFTVTYNYGTGSEDSRMGVDFGDSDGDGDVDIAVGVRGGQSMVYDGRPGIHGRIYSDDDTTLDDASGATIRAYNCTTGAQVGTATATTATNFIVPMSTTPSDGDMIAVYTDTGTSADLCMTVFYWNTATSTSMSNIHLRKGFVRFNSNDYGGTNDFRQDTDPEFLEIDTGTNASNIVSVTANNFNTVAGIGLELVSGVGYTSDVLLTTGQTHDINGDFVVDDGCIFAGFNSTVYVNGDILFGSGASYVGSTAGAFVMDGTTQSVTTNAVTLAGMLVSTGTTTIEDDSTLSVGVQVSSGATLELQSGITATMAFLILSSGGVCNIDDDETIAITNTGEIRVDGGTLNVRGSDPSASSTAGNLISSTGSPDSWKLEFYDSATLDIRGARIVDGFVESNNSATTTTPTQISIIDTHFYALPTTATDNSFINMSGVTSGFIELRDLHFTRLQEDDSSSNVETAANARNISSDASTMELVQVLGYSGPLGGEAFDDDATGKVRWINSNVPLKQDDGSVTYQRSLSEAVENVGAGTLDIFANYVDSNGDIVSSGNIIVGTLVVPDFSGTLNLDGFTFVTLSAANSTVIDTSAVVSGGEINLYNCMVVDPYSTAGAPVYIDFGASLADGGGVTATLCSLDTTNAVTSVFKTATDCVIARSASTTDFVDLDYSVGARARNLRLTKTGHATFAAASSLPAGHERDIDGKLRPSAAQSDVGCSYYGLDDSAAIYKTIDDITGGLATTEDAVTSPYISMVNVSAGGYYATAYDGTNCFLVFIDWDDQTIGASLKTSWTGSRCANPTFVQCSDDSDKYWIYVPYAKDSPDKVDTLRRVRHNVSAETFSDQSNVGDGSANLTSNDGTDTDVTGNAGWDGQLYISNSFVSGATETLFVITTTDSNGEIHTFYVNTDSADGNFYKEAAFTTSARAAESFTSGGSININPNPAAPVLLSQAPGSGELLLTRFRDATHTGALMSIDRSSGDGDLTVGKILNAYTGPALDQSFSAFPGILTNTNGGLASAYDSEPKIYHYDGSSLSGDELDLSAAPYSLPLSSYGAVSGVNIRQDAYAYASWIPFYSESDGKGVIAAVEYWYDQDGDSTLELLDGTSGDAVLSYTGTGGEAGSFANGIAYVTGKPVAIINSRSAQGLWAATDAGYVYGWSASGTHSSETAASKGLIKSGYPKQFGKAVTHLDFYRVSDATILTALGKGSTSFFVGAKLDTGEVILMPMS